MNKPKESPLLVFDKFWPWIVLVLLLVYTYAKFFEHPYIGFRAGPPGDVILIFDRGAQSALHIGDRIIQIDSIRWEDFRYDLRMSIFGDVRPGQVLSLLIERGSEQISIPWKVVGFNLPEFFDLLISEGWLGFFFWIVGTFTLLVLRPKDVRWQLMIAFNYLTAIWLVLGSGVSFYHIWQSAIFLRMAIWICIPVYLHLHWVFPSPLGKLPNFVIWFGYIVAGLFAILEWFQLLPRSLYSTGFLLAAVGSFLLLLLHAFLRPESRRDLRLFIVIAFISLLPAVVIGTALGFFGEQYGLLAAWIRGGGALLGLPLLPVAYLYAAFRRRLGALELRINRLLSTYIFVILLGSLGLPLALLLDLLLTFPGKSLAIAFVAAVLTAAAFIWIYPAFKSFMDRRIYAIPLPSKRLLETYSARITTSNSLAALLQVLEVEILPSLLIRQFAFLQLEQGSLKALSKMGLNEEQLPKEEDVPYLMTQSGVYRSPDVTSRDMPFSWVRLILPLKLGDQLLGFWLLGRRDPDDIYSQLEIPILSSLANLTAIALSNILQTEQLKSMYEMNIVRDEEERRRLSRDLHDSILNEMAALLMRDDAPIFSPTFQKAFETLTERLREIVSDLRPSALNLGLKLALEDLAEKLTERNQERVEVVTDIQTDGEWRYPDDVENHVYRIVQEACRNALKYARAKTITIFGRLHRQEIDIRVQDDGIGFGSEVSLKLDQMLAKRHFGLVGMLERAKLIGAEVSIHSTPQQGTKIQVTWKSKETI
jgi:signal transduction histidine kinase